jgi:hypothetical protein
MRMRSAGANHAALSPFCSLPLGRRKKILHHPDFPRVRRPRRECDTSPIGMESEMTSFNGQLRFSPAPVSDRDVPYLACRGTRASFRKAAATRRYPGPGYSTRRPSSSRKRGSGRPGMERRWRLPGQAKGVGGSAVGPGPAPKAVLQRVPQSSRNPAMRACVS